MSGYDYSAYGAAPAATDPYAQGYGHPGYAAPPPAFGGYHANPAAAYGAPPPAYGGVEEVSGSIFGGRDRKNVSHLKPFCSRRLSYVGIPCSLLKIHASGCAVGWPGH